MKLYKIYVDVNKIYINTLKEESVCARKIKVEENIHDVLANLIFFYVRMYIVK